MKNLFLLALLTVGSSTSFANDKDLLGDDFKPATPKEINELAMRSHMLVHSCVGGSQCFSPENPKDNEGKRKFYFFFDLQKGVVNGNGTVTQNESPVSVINPGSFAQSYGPSTGKSRHSVLDMSDSDLREAMKEKYGADKKDAIDAAIILKNTAHLGSEAAMDQYLKTATVSMSFSQKVNVVASFLKQFGDYYDYDRIDSSKMASKGSVTLMDMMKATDSNLRNGTSIDAGVCRDMHQGAARLAQAMGIPEAFGVGFRTYGGGHRTLVMTDPNDRKMVYNLNYGGVTVQEGVSGVEALAQNHSLPDTGMRFRLYSANNTPAIILPSARGGLLNKVSGGEDSQLDAHYESSANELQQAGVGSKFGNLRVFYNANQSNNEVTMGVAYNIEIQYYDSKHFRAYGGYGVAGFTTKRETIAGELSQKGVYARTTQGMEIKIYATEKVKFSVMTEVNGRVMYSSDKIGNGKNEDNIDFNVDLDVGARAQYEIGKTRNMTQFVVRGQLDAISPLDSDVGMTMNFNTFSFSHRTDIDITKNTTVNVNGTLTGRDLGTGKLYIQYKFGTGLENRKTNTTVDLSSEGAITGDLPLWVPGSEKQGRAEIRQGIGKNLYVGVKGNQSYENIGNHSAFLLFGGKF